MAVAMGNEWSREGEFGAVGDGGFQCRNQGTGTSVTNGGEETGWGSSFSGFYPFLGCSITQEGREKKRGGLGTETILNRLSHQPIRMHCGHSPASNGMCRGVLALINEWSSREGAEGGEGTAAGSHEGTPA